MLAVINPVVVIVFPEILPNEVIVCPDGTVIPAFAVINPVAVILPFSFNTNRSVSIPDDDDTILKVPP